MRLTMGQVRSISVLTFRYGEPGLRPVMPRAIFLALPLAAAFTALPVVG